jgi:hypothetical protein
MNKLCVKCQNIGICSTQNESVIEIFTNFKVVLRIPFKTKAAHRVISTFIVLNHVKEK